MIVTIDLDDDIVRHFQSKECGARYMEPCAFAEVITQRVHDSIRFDRHVFTPTEFAGDTCAKCGDNFRNTLKHIAVGESK